MLVKIFDILSKKRKKIIFDYKYFIIVGFILFGFFAVSMMGDLGPGDLKTQYDVDGGGLSDTPYVSIVFPVNYEKLYPYETYDAKVGWKYIIPLKFYFSDGGFNLKSYSIECMPSESGDSYAFSTDGEYIDVSSGSLNDGKASVEITTSVTLYIVKRDIWASSWSHKILFHTVVKDTAGNIKDSILDRTIEFVFDYDSDSVVKTTTTIEENEQPVTNRDDLIDDPAGNYDVDDFFADLEVPFYGLDIVFVFSLVYIYRRGKNIEE